MSVAIIDTGCANIFSVQAALDRLGCVHGLAATPEQAEASDRLVLPGVGAAGPAMARLKTSGWAESLVGESRPLLGICLGMQLLFESSAEGGVEGLALLSGTVEAMPCPANGVLPHMGWNTLDPITPNDPLLRGVSAGAHVYFVHSFAVQDTNSVIATTAYGAKFVAAARRHNVMGCQFHPERSGATGSRILTNFLEI